MTLIANPTTSYSIIELILFISPFDMLDMMSLIDWGEMLIEFNLTGILHHLPNLLIYMSMMSDLPRRVVIWRVQSEIDPTQSLLHMWMHCYVLIELHILFKWAYEHSGCLVHHYARSDVRNYEPLTPWFWSPDNFTMGPGHDLPVNCLISKYLRIDLKLP